MPQSYRGYLVEEYCCNRQGLRMPLAKMAQFSGISSDFHYNDCKEFAATLVFSQLDPLLYFVSYYEEIDFSVCGPYV